MPDVLSIELMNSFTLGKEIYSSLNITSTLSSSYSMIWTGWKFFEIGGLVLWFR